MEFWGVEVKAGEHFKVELHEKKALHLSQACIGEVEKESSESICLFVSIDGKIIALGTLNTEKIPQQSFDLVFNKTFELFHNWKNGNVFFHGYTAINDTSSLTSIEDDSHTFEESSSDEDIPAIAPNATEVKQEGPKVSAIKNSTAGKQKVKAVEPKKNASSEDSDDSSDDDDDDATSSEDDRNVSSGKVFAAGKQKVKIVEPKKDVSSEDSDDTSDDDATSSEDEPKVSARKDSAARKQKAKIVEPKNDASSEDDADSSDDDDAVLEDDSEDDEDNKSASDEDSDSDEDEVTPVQVKSSKKRALVSASKPAVSEKKAKLHTPKNNGSKKSSVHVDTPYPSKQPGKTPATKPNPQMPKTEGSYSCKPCKKTFKSEVALESHNKAKHSSAK